jgi:hypothetical protein
MDHSRESPPIPTESRFANRLNESFATQSGENPTFGCRGQHRHPDPKLAFVARLSTILRVPSQPRTHRSGTAALLVRGTVQTGSAFIRTHLALLAGTDFFTAEVLTLRGLVTYYVLFFIHLESRRVDIAGITIHPDEPWMRQIARNVTMEGCGTLRDCRYLLHDRDTKYTQSFRAIIASGRVEPLVLPARSPNLNAYAERWVRSVKEECLSKLILFGERSLRRALSEYVEHYHAERNHQGKDNVLLFPRDTDVHREGLVQCRERLGGLLRYYQAAVRGRPPPRPRPRQSRSCSQAASIRFSPASSRASTGPAATSPGSASPATYPSPSGWGSCMP